MQIRNARRLSVILLLFTLINDEISSHLEYLRSLTDEGYLRIYWEVRLKKADYQEFYFLPQVYQFTLLNVLCYTE